MILDKIKTYLEGRRDIEYKELPVVLDSCNIDTLVEKYPIRVHVPLNGGGPLHHINDLNEFAMRLFEDLKTKTHDEGYIFNEANYNGKTFDRPKIVYITESIPIQLDMQIISDTDKIVIDSNILKRSSTYTKEVELEFF